MEKKMEKKMEEETALSYKCRARALRGASRENTTGQAAAGVRVDRVTRQCT
jgi:hypothetical protein